MSMMQCIPFTNVEQWCALEILVRVIQGHWQMAPFSTVYFCAVFFTTEPDHWHIRWSNRFFKISCVYW